MHIRLPDAKLVLIIVLALAVLMQTALRWYQSRYAPEGTYILAFGGLLVLPRGYAFDLPSYTNKSGASFVLYRRPQGRVVLGSYGELKPDFWDWVNRSKVSEIEQCGTKVLRLTDGDAFATLLHDSKEYVFLARVPEEDVSFALRTLCTIGR